VVTAVVVEVGGNAVVEAVVDAEQEARSIAAANEQINPNQIILFFNVCLLCFNKVI